MEKERSSKVIAIVALIVGVVGLSLGFAAITNTLTIKSSASVEVDTDLAFNVDFDADQLEADNLTVVPTGNFGGEAVNATIDNSAAPTITGLTANFTVPGQSAVYSFYTRNKGTLIAYLQSATFANVEGKSATKVCTPAPGTNADLVAAACNNISISVKVGNETAVEETSLFGKAKSASTASHALAVGAWEPVVVTITYAENGTVTDGDFSIAFGDITLLYSSVDGESGPTA